MQIILGADHRGFELKEKIKTALLGRGHEVKDVGAHTYDVDDDYPDFAAEAAHIVAQETGSFGVLLCGSGMGMDMVANKVKGIRATIVRTKEEAVYARDHDDVNVMTLAADHISENEAVEIVETFVSTNFSGEAKHERRLNKLKQIEAASMK